MNLSAIQGARSIDKIFPSYPDDPSDLTTDKVWELLGHHALLSLAYGNDVGRNPGYIFRGEIDYVSPLQTSIERKIYERDRTITPKQLKDAERTIITKYLTGEGQRVAVMIEGQARSREDVFWWLSLMQHYRWQTRFLDFTRDIRIALFFALEHQSKWEQSKCELRSNSLIIYCFPCRDPQYPHDPHNNKTPYAPIDKGIDMNLALGGQIGLHWIVQRHKDDLEQNYSTKNKQTWGWDRPYFENPRLCRQKGMFVYPFDDPLFDLNKAEDSWLVRQLVADREFISSELRSKRLKIPFELASELSEQLKRRYYLTEATVYLNPDLVRTDFV